MKQLKIIFGILIVIALIVTIVLLVKFNNKNSSNNDKPISEVMYLDSELTEMINSINNVSTENYKISVSKLSTTQESSQSSSEGSSDESSSEEESSEQSQNTQSSDESSQTQNSSNSGEQYELEENGILNNSSTIPEWDELKSKVENLYSLIPTTTLDFYSSNISQSEILDFNRELDNLTIAVKEENKDDALQSLAKLYSYLPGYFEELSNDNVYKIILETKSNVINAYSLIDSDDWDEISNYVQLAIDSYTPLLNEIEVQSKEYSINRAYIILNELKNAVELENRDVFLIKYKYLIDEFEAIV